MFLNKPPKAIKLKQKNIEIFSLSKYKRHPIYDWVTVELKIIASASDRSFFWISKRGLDQI